MERKLDLRDLSHKIRTNLKLLCGFLK